MTNPALADGKQEHAGFATQSTVLGRDAKSLQAAYRELFRYELDPGLVDEIRKAVNGNFALGNALFAEQVAAELGRRVVRGEAGRPFKKIAPESGRLFE